MKYRKLRIAWSVAWGVVAVLLCLLWMRSRSWSDGVSIPYLPSGFVEVKSYKGGFHYVDVHYSGDAHGPVRFFSRHDQPSDPKFPPRWQFRFENGRYCLISAPHWYFIVASILFAAIPNIDSIPYRFSLRTLLIATTLVAVGLGAVVYAMRS